MALAVAACSSVPETRQVLLPDLPKNAEANSPSVREHQRVLSAYGGAYEDPRLHAKLTSIVNRLVAASDRPDLSYKITILNSPAVNAFALPNRQLYLTSGLLCLTHHTAKLAWLISHETPHRI